MGGKLKRPLTKAEKRKRRAPLMRHEDRQRSFWLLIGGVEVAAIIFVFKYFGV